MLPDFFAIDPLFAIDPSLPASAFAEVQRKRERKRRNRRNLITLGLAILFYVLLRWLMN